MAKTGLVHELHQLHGGAQATRAHGQQIKVDIGIAFWLLARLFGHGFGYQ
jgi:hypothetical protein